MANENQVYDLGTRCISNTIDDKSVISNTKPISFLKNNDDDEEEEKVVSCSEDNSVIELSR